MYKSQANKKIMVKSYNEWDPLKCIIVGTLQGIRVPPFDETVKANSYPQNWKFFNEYGGKEFPKEMLDPAIAELDNFCHVLESEGVTVYRPEPVDFSQSVKTPFFESTLGYSNAAMCRDHISIFGETIIEAPHAWRSRFGEHWCYRKLRNLFTQHGAKWITGPQPTCADDIYDLDYPLTNKVEDRHKLAMKGKFVIKNKEICFDTADFFRCGQDVFAQLSQVTNFLGIQWVNNILGKDYRMHILQFKDPNPMHTDATFQVIRAGLAITNPDRPCVQVDIFKKAGWDVIEAATPCLSKDWPMPLSSHWLSMNFLVLSGGGRGERGRVVVEEQETHTHKLMHDLGFEVIKIPFRHCYSFGGGPHCYTADLYREGILESYGFAEPEPLEIQYHKLQTSDIREVVLTPV